MAFPVCWLSLFPPDQLSSVPLWLERAPSRLRLRDDILGPSASLLGVTDVCIWGSSRGLQEGKRFCLLTSFLAMRCDAVRTASSVTGGLFSAVSRESLPYFPGRSRLITIRLCSSLQFGTSSHNQLAEKVRLRLRYEEAKRR